jgi:hypothetical protein
MNVPTAKTPSANRSHGTVVALPARRERRERDFGIGYGTSSGYGNAKRYTKDWGLTRFRFA